MDRLFLLGLLLLCFLRVEGIRCKQCSSYKEKTCKESNNYCNLKNNESCMIKRIISPLNTETVYEMIQTGCAINCKNSEKSSATQLTVTYCCKHRNFCNDPFLPLSVF